MIVKECINLQSETSKKEFLYTLLLIKTFTIMLKKLFAVAFLAVMTIGASAQEFKKFRIGPTVGLNVATMNLEANHSSRIGFSVGALAEYNFSDHFFATAALKFSQKGVKFNNLLPNATNTGLVDLKVNPCYIEIPIHAGYRYSFNDKFSIFGEVGPNIGIGVCGKYKADGYNSENFFGDTGVSALLGKTKRFDFGIGFAAGVEYAKCQLRIGYDLGLTKVWDVDGSAKNRNLFFALSYMF